MTITTIQQFKSMKDNHQKISMITCYDYTFAKIISQSQIDCILVGDTSAMTMHGFPTTVNATVDLISTHIQAVARAVNHTKFIIGDMPFCSYRKSLSSNMESVEKLMQAGSHGIKLEGADEKNLKLIHHIVNSGIPVMGHIGLTPQSVNLLGGFKVQGKDKSVANQIKLQAKLLQQAGCFGIVLECMPAQLAKEITDDLNIPTIGIGAGPYTSGQVLVLQDLLGMNPDFKAKFVKAFLNGFELIQQAVNQYDHEVKNNSYPDLDQHVY